MSPGVPCINPIRISSSYLLSILHVSNDGATEFGKGRLFHRAGSIFQSVPVGSPAVPSGIFMLLRLTTTHEPISSRVRSWATILVKEMSSICNICIKMRSGESVSFLRISRSGTGSLHVNIEGFGRRASSVTFGGSVRPSLREEEALANILFFLLFGGLENWWFRLAYVSSLGFPVLGGSIGRKFKGTIWRGSQFQVMRSTGIGGGTVTNSSDVLFIELWTNDCYFDKVFDICHAGETTQGGRESFLDMAVCVAGHFDFVPSEVEVGEHAIVGATSIVERELIDVRRGSVM